MAHYFKICVLPRRKWNICQIFGKLYRARGDREESHPAEEWVLITNYYIGARRRRWLQRQQQRVVTLYWRVHFMFLETVKRELNDLTWRRHNAKNALEDLLTLWSTLSVALWSALKHAEALRDVLECSGAIWSTMGLVGLWTNDSSLELDSKNAGPLGRRSS